MIRCVGVSAGILASVNFPLIYLGSTKRLAMLLLVGCFCLLFSYKKLAVNRCAYPMIFFWTAYIISTVVGAIVNQYAGSFLVSIFFTFSIVCLYVFILGSGVFPVASLVYAVLILDLIGFLYILKAIDFDISRLLFLRAYLLDANISINSIFNQFYCLFFYNLLLSVISTKFRKCFLFASFAIFMVTFFSLSRQNFLAISLMVAVFSFLQRPLRAFLFFVVFCAGAFYILGFSGGPLGQVVSRVEKTQAQITSGEYSRFKQYVDSIEVGLAKPFLGVGVGGFYEFAARKGYPEHTRVPEAAINQLVAEHGLFILVFFIAMFTWYFSFALKLNRGVVRNVSVSYLIGFLFLCFFNEVHVTPMLWVSLLMIISIKNHEKESIRGIHSIASRFNK